MNSTARGLHRPNFPKIFNLSIFLLFLLHLLPLLLHLPFAQSAAPVAVAVAYDPAWVVTSGPAGGAYNVKQALTPARTNNRTLEPILLNVRNSTQWARLLANARVLVIAGPGQAANYTEGSGVAYLNFSSSSPSNSSSATLADVVRNWTAAGGLLVQAGRDARVLGFLFPNSTMSLYSLTTNSSANASSSSLSAFARPAATNSTPYASISNTSASLPPLSTSWELTSVPDAYCLYSTFVPSSSPANTTTNNNTTASNNTTTTGNNTTTTGNNTTTIGNNTTTTTNTTSTANTTSTTDTSNTNTTSTANTTSTTDTTNNSSSTISQRDVGASDGRCSVLRQSYGAGRVVYLAWDFTDAAPEGAQDGTQWLQVLYTAVLDDLPVVSASPNLTSPSPSPRAGNQTEEEDDGPPPFQMTMSWVVAVVVASLVVLVMVSALVMAVNRCQRRRHYKEIPSGDSDDEQQVDDDDDDEMYYQHQQQHHR